MAGRTVGRRSARVDDWLARREGGAALDTRTMAAAGKPESHIEHYDNGTVKMTGFHLDGEMHGTWEFFRLDGTLMRTGAFARGRQFGPSRTFDRAGRMVKETDFGAAPDS
jgi:hypothetical protein